MSEQDLTLRTALRAVQLYAETHPRPTQVTQAQVAEILGVSTRTVRNYISAGKLRLNKCGRVPIEAVECICPKCGIRHGFTGMEDAGF